jgi:amino acid adenylation domain-containing protein
MQSAVLVQPVPERTLPLPHPPADSSLCDAIASHAASAPERPAVVDPNGTLSYGELDRRSDQLAAALRAAGVGPEVCVGLFLERSAEFVTAALAVLKAGAAYLPLDPSTPPDRAAFVLTDAAAPLVLSHRGKAAALPPGAWRVLELDGPEGSAVRRRDAEPVRADAPADGLAYVIYTSGSTGRPKGVEVTRANLANLVAWHRAAFGVTADDRASQVAGLGFDAAVWEIWPHLAAGATLFIADEVTRRSAQLLRDWLLANRITIGFVPTVLAEQLLHGPWPADTALRTMLTGADTLRRRPAAGLPFVLVNNYGPTECTVVATSGAVEPTADADGPPSIGRPVADTRAFILDDALRPVAPGEVGELCLGGALVARGYRNDPDRTADRFVTVTPPDGPPLRVYRTGDRVRLLPGGDLAFLGRLDDQVKIRGYRVELGEVASALARCPGVGACAVTAPVGPDGPALVAHVVAAPGAELTATGLRAFLAVRLPDYMIPTQFVALASLPVTANGKLDRAALPPPAADNLLPQRVAEPARGDGVRERIAALVGSLLGVADVDPEEDVFLMGGHSMFGVQLLARIGETFGVKLTLRQLFGGPTVAALAAEVTRLRKSDA